VNSIEIAGKSYTLKKYGVLLAEQIGFVSDAVLTARDEWGKDPMNDEKKKKYSDLWDAFCALQLRETDLGDLTLEKIDISDYRRLNDFFGEGMRLAVPTFPAGSET